MGNFFGLFGTCISFSYYVFYYIYIVTFTFCNHAFNRHFYSKQLTDEEHVKQKVKETCKHLLEFLM